MAFLTDSSLNNFTVTSFGNVSPSTSVKKFGSGAAYFDGSGDYLAVSHNLDFTDSSFYTLEAWVFAISLDGVNAIAGVHVSQQDSRTQMYVYSNGALGIGKVGSNEITSLPNQIQTNTWHHVAAVKSGGTTKLFIDGEEKLLGQTPGSIGPSTPVWSGPSGQIRVGYFAPGNGSNWNGYIDDLRITKGVARYTANFTPPAAAFPNPAALIPQNGLSLWLKADAGVTTSGSNVTAWADQSGNSRNATNSTYGTPSLTSIDGKPFVFFDGSNALTGPNVVNSLPVSIFLVVNYDTVEEIGVIFEQYSGGDNIALYRGYNGGSALNFRLFNGDNLSSNLIVPSNQTALLGAIVNGSNSFLYLNGTQTATGNAGNITPAGDYFLGYWRGANVGRRVKIGEVIVYNKVITTQERQQIEAYLNTKYAIY